MLPLVTQDSLQQWEKWAVLTHAPLRGPGSVSPAAPQRPCDGSGEMRATQIPVMQSPGGVHVEALKTCSTWPSSALGMQPTEPNGIVPL